MAGAGPGADRPLRRHERVGPGPSQRRISDFLLNWPSEVDRRKSRSPQSPSAHVATYKEKLMSKFRMLLGVLLVAFLVGGLALAQEKKDTKDTPPAKAKGTLPANWKKLGLTDDQVQKVYQIQADHRG